MNDASRENGESATEERGVAALYPNTLLANARATSSTFDCTSFDHSVINNSTYANTLFTQSNFTESVFALSNLDAALFERCSLRGVEFRHCTVEGLVINGINVGALLQLLTTHKGGR
jgi:uncharacterized protein YjbI with pentapeptide repeats